MRFLHTSDWHLGRTLHGVDLLDAQRAVLEQICRLVAEPPDGVPVDAVIIAGDVYDRAVPPVEAVSLFADTLAELTRHSTVIVTAGNHDSAIRLGFGSRLFTDRLRVHTELAAIGEPVLLTRGRQHGRDLPAALPGSGRRPGSCWPTDDAAAGPLAPGGDGGGACAGSGRTWPAGRGVRSVVVAHAFVVGGAASDSERSIVVGGVDSVAGDTFAGVDYVALGHLHGAQQPRCGRPARCCAIPARRCGIPFPRRQHSKSVTLVDLTADRPPPVLRGAADASRARWPS